MKKMCDWCGKGESTLEEVEILGGVAHICKDCAAKHKEGVCITCGEPLYSSVSMGGECLACMQIRSAAAEKRKCEAMNGMGLELLEKMIESSEITTEDYYKWMAASSPSYTKQNSEDFKRGWLEDKLIRKGSWSQDEFDTNYADIRFIMDNNHNAAFVFRGSTKFILMSKDKRIPSGSVILARKNNVALVRV